MPYLQIKQDESSRWGNIGGDISKQSDLAQLLIQYSRNNHSHPEYSPINTELLSEIEEHLESIANPHQVTKAQVGLMNLSNDAQLRRRASDFMEFNEKLSICDNDIFLIEDSEDNHNKKKVKAICLRNYILG